MARYSRVNSPAVAGLDRGLLNQGSVTAGRTASLMVRVDAPTLTCRSSISVSCVGICPLSSPNPDQTGVIGIKRPNCDAK